MSNTVKIIIAISKETYDHVCDIYNRLPTPKEEMEIEDSIRNCTPLSEVLAEIKGEISKLDDINPDYPMDRTIHINRNEVLEIIDKHISGEGDKE